MADSILIDTRGIGKEDLLFDSQGTGEQTSFTDANGVQHTLSKLNASHIPLPAGTRIKCGGETNVADGMETLSDMISEISTESPLSEDTTVTLTSTLTHAEKQALINSQLKNLGGHTLTFLFPEALNLTFSEELYFGGFFNGTVVIDLNNIQIQDNSDAGQLIRFFDCHCKAEIKQGTLKHTYSNYGVKAERCPCIYLTNIAFESNNGSTRYALYAVDCDGYVNGCSYTNDKQRKVDGILSDLINSDGESMINTHNNAANAHPNRFDPSGTATTAVENHNNAQNPHPNKFESAGAVSTHNNAANPHSGKFDAAGTAATAVSTHNNAANPHSGKFDAAGTAAAAVSAHNLATGAHLNGFNHLLVVANNDPQVTLQDTNYAYNVTPSANQYMSFLMADSSGNERASYSFAVSTTNTSYLYIRLYKHGSLGNRAEMRFEYDINGNKRIYSDFTLTDVVANTQASGDNSTKVATTAFVQAAISTNFTSNIAANGWQKLSSGLIIQWGTAAANGNNQNFPITFPHAAFAIVQSGTSSWDRGQAFQIVNTSQFKVVAESFQSTTWIAIGY